MYVNSLYMYLKLTVSQGIFTLFLHIPLLNGRQFVQCSVPLPNLIGSVRSLSRQQKNHCAPPRARGHKREKSCVSRGRKESEASIYIPPARSHPSISSSHGGSVSQAAYFRRPLSACIEKILLNEQRSDNVNKSPQMEWHSLLWIKIEMLRDDFDIADFLFSLRTDRIWFLFSIQFEGQQRMSDLCYQINVFRRGVDKVDASSKYSLAEFVDFNND